jgi:CheY-like chemotaxis protein
MTYCLEGCGILVVEDEPLIALDITDALESAGASVTTASTLQHALLAVERSGLAGAIIDHALADGSSALLCHRLKERQIPFVVYSGSNKHEGECGEAPHIKKPVTGDQLVLAVAEVIFGRA